MAALRTRGNLASYWTLLSFLLVSTANAYIYLPRSNFPSDSVLYNRNTSTFIGLWSIPALFGPELFPASREHAAHLQYLHENPFLCSYDPKNSSFVDPESHWPDGVPVALLVWGGQCSFYHKALIAQDISDNIHYLIVINNDPNSTKPYVMELEPHEHGEAVDVALLSVWFRDGLVLKEFATLEGRNYSDKELAGPILILDGIGGAELRFKTATMMYTLNIVAFMLSCTISVCGNRHWNRSGSRVSGRSPLTAADILRYIPAMEAEQRHPIHSGDVSTSPSQVTDRENSTAELDEEESTRNQCPICLNDLENGEYPPTGTSPPQCLRLPCRHAFHTECVVPWLTEQQPECPMCRFDVSEFIEQQRSEYGAPNATNENNVNCSRWSMFRQNFFSRRHHWTPVDRSATEDDQAGEMELRTFT